MKLTKSLRAILGISLLIMTLEMKAQASEEILDGDQKNIPVLVSNENIQFEYTSPRSSYHCDFVKAETAAILRKLGATQIFVSCTGGIPYGRTNYVQAQFQSLRQTTVDKSTRKAGMTQIILQFHQLCDLHEKIMAELLVGFDVFNYTDSGVCNFSNGEKGYDFATLL